MLWWQTLLLMFGGLAVLMGTGMPIAIAFGLLNVALFFFFAGGEGALQAVALSSYGSVATFTFTALPMFIVMGEVILHSGLAKLAIDAMGKWLGRMPGRLAVLAVIGGTVFGAASGSSMASAAMLGRVLIPEMRARGYDKGLAVGCIATCGALDILIPPSALGVIFAGIARLSVADILIGCLIPGLILAVLIFGYIIVICTLKPHLAPPYDVEPVPLREKIQSLVHVLPLFALILLVLGTMFFGWATPTESAAMGAVGAFIVAALYGKLSRQVIRKSLMNAVEVTGLALLIITSATAFSQVLAHTGAASGLAEFATSLPVSPWIILIGMQLVMLVMGLFIDEVSIMLITIPIFFPVVKSLGFDPTWFAIVSMVNMEIGVISPPFGLVLFVLKGVCPPDITMGDIFRGVMPFIAVNLVALALIMAFPPLATWLPGLMH
ncbi:MAG: TRAP transporter large permease subunit [Betaproteobacteria bacterium]|nr:TRAP transporter large permease subunit [Betaproteobacteria bacterium]